jgi:hypothetical protein
MAVAEKLKSRKLWIAFAVIVLTAFSQHFGLEMDLGQWLTLGLATFGYSVGQGWVDAAEKVNQPGKSQNAIVTLGDLGDLIDGLSDDDDSGKLPN